MFIGQRFNHNALDDQRDSMASNQDIGDFVNFGDVVASNNPIGQGADGDDTCLLTPEELNQMLP